MTIGLCGYNVLIDDSDSQKVLPFDWHIGCMRKGGPYFKSWVRIDGKRRHLFLHRWLVSLIEADHRIVDHISCNTLDNRRSNLRICKAPENKWNVGKNAANTTGYKGVCFDKSHNKYIAQITVRGKRINLGRAKTAEEAFRFYCEAAKKYHGEFARPE